jgi:hypothetical protein
MQHATLYRHSYTLLIERCDCFPHHGVPVLWPNLLLGHVLCLQVLMILDSENPTQFADLLNQFRGRRVVLTLGDLYRLYKGVAAKKVVNKNDVAGLEQLVKQLRALGIVLYYQPQQWDEDGNITQHLVLVLADPFGIQFLKAFAASPGRLVLLDATGGTNTYGYLLHAFGGGRVQVGRARSVHAHL